MTRDGTVRLGFMALASSAATLALAAGPPNTPVAGLTTGPAAELAKPVPILAGDKPIDVEIGHAAPFFADFNGDGKSDLLVGQFGGGKLRVYTNVGTNREPKFNADFAWFQADRQDGKVPAS